MHRVLKAGFAVAGSGAAARSNANVTSWNSRYVVLTGTCISIHNDLNSMGKPIQSVVIIPDSTAEAACAEGDDYAGATGSSEFRVFVRDPPGAHFFLMFSSSQEQVAWIDAIRRAIRLSRFALKAYITNVIRKGIIVKRPRKYFVLDDKIITRHRDYDKVWEIEGFFKFSVTTKTLYNDETSTITLMNRAAEDDSLELCFEEAKGDYLKWKDLIAKMVTASEEKIDKINAALASSLKHGNVYHRIDVHGGQSEWRECSAVLTKTSLILQEVEPGGAVMEGRGVNFDPSKCITILDFSPDSSCIETSESLCSFQVSNRGKLLRLRESSSHEMRTWIKLISRCVAQASPRMRDTILSSAVRLIKKDVFYSATFNVAGPLGFDMEPREEGWVVVSRAQPDSGVHKGSVLTSIGGKNLLMQSPADVLSQFVDWKPPLTLHFRKAPEISGYLSEKVSGALGSKWKRRFFIMTCGQLERHEDHHSLATHVIPLAGAAVFEIKGVGEGTQRILCFRFVSGSDSLLLQADSTDELLSWMGGLCHGIAIANGGSYVRRVEQARVSRLIRMKQKGRHHKRVSTMGMLDLEFSVELGTFENDGSTNAMDQSQSGSVGNDQLHEEERWWWNMGGSSGDLAELAVDLRFDDNSSADSSSARDATNEIMNQTNFYGKSCSPSAGGSVSLDKRASSKKSLIGDSTRTFVEQQRIQAQLNRIQGDAEASHEFVRSNLRQKLDDVGVSLDHSELEAALNMAELWGVHGPEKEKAEALLMEGRVKCASPPRPTYAATKLVKSPKRLGCDNMLNMRTLMETAPIFQNAATSLEQYPSHSPCNLSYNWSLALKSTVEGAVNRGSYLFPEAQMHGRVENWKGQQDRTFSIQTPDTALPCIHSEELGQYPDRSRVFVMDSCVQIFLNNLFIRELKQNKDGLKVLLGDDTGLLISSYDEICVCDVPGHFSLIIRINLHASADIATAGTNIKGDPQSPDSQSSGSSCENVTKLSHSTDPRPVVRWIGAREGDLFDNLQSVLATYLGRSQRLQEMQNAAIGNSASLVETFSGVSNGAILEEVDYSDLHLKTVPEGRIDFEVKCASRQERDALFLSIFYLVPAGKPKPGFMPLVPRHFSLRDRVRCLPWNIATEATAAARAISAKEFPVSKKQANEYEETIKKLQTDMSNLISKHAREMKGKDDELSKLRDRLNGQFGIL